MTDQTPAPTATPFAAHQWARQGFEIVPMKRMSADKKRSLIGWKDGGLTKLGQINFQWRRHPDAMIGVILPKGWAVVDIDKHADRPNGFKTLEEHDLLGTVRKGVCVLTLSGEHRWFKSDKSFTSRGILSLPGVDLRSTGCIVIVPGTKGYGTPGIKGLGEFFKRLNNAPMLPAELETLAELKRERFSDRDPEELRMEEERARQCVPYIVNPDYDWDTWKKVIGALHAASDGLDWGQELAHEFSSRSDKYDYYGTERAWDEIDRSPYGDVGGGTLVHLAREGGMPGPGAEVSASDVFDDEEMLADLIGEEKPSKSSWLDFPDATRWQSEPPRPLEWTVEELVPKGMLTEMAGDGGAGKSMLGQIAATCVAAGKPWLGHEVKGGSAVYLTGEDPDSVLYARQRRINKELNINMSNLCRLHPASASNEDISLFYNGKTTGLLARIEEQLARIADLQLVVIDSASIVFDDDEIKRRSVKSFLLALNRLAARLDIGVVLVVHTSKNSEQTSAKAISGSTGWGNHARSVLLLTKDDDTPVLKVVKPNHTTPIEPIRLCWSDNGVLVTTDENIESEDAKTLELDCEIVRLVDVAEKRGLPLSASPNATKDRSLAKLLAKKGKGARDKTTAAMNRLIDDGVLTVGRHGDATKSLKIAKWPDWCPRGKPK